MTSETIFEGIPGGRALIDWFGYTPHFHDGNLLEIALNGWGSSTLRIHAYRITDKIDAQGYFILDKHTVVTFTLEGVTIVNLQDFNLPGIIGSLDIARIENEYQFTWDVAYGVQGTIRAQHVRIELQPGEP